MSNLTESTTKLGFFTESAKGESMADLLTSERVSVAEAERGRAADLTQRVGLDDPVLQQCMNKLQIIDAIAGQLDRHGGNDFVQRDPATGKVLGLTGIDNDMAFGEQGAFDSNDLHHVLDRARDAVIAGPVRHLEAEVRAHPGPAIDATCDNALRAIADSRRAKGSP